MSTACRIDIVATGPAADVEAFREAFLRPTPEEYALRPGELSTNFGAFVPEPDPTATDDQRSGWMRKNWGPRWDALGVELADDQEPGQLALGFWVKDGEPTPVIKAASAAFPTLDIEYWYQFEDGSDQDNRTYRAGVDVDA